MSSSNLIEFTAHGQRLFVQPAHVVTVRAKRNPGGEVEAGKTVLSLSTGATQEVDGEESAVAARIGTILPS
jgi:hypothetical protein